MSICIRSTRLTCTFCRLSSAQYRSALWPRRRPASVDASMCWTVLELPDRGSAAIPELTDRGQFESAGTEWWDRSWGGYFGTFNDFLSFGWEVMGECRC